jgi:hypothetical protein
MDTISIAAAAVTGARHQRAARNGQDAVATFQGTGTGGNGSGSATVRGSDVGWLRCVDNSSARCGVVVVADGCGSGESSEVGARLGATLFARAVGTRLERGASIVDRRTWEDARADVSASLAELAQRTQGCAASFDASRELIHDCFLFTIVAAACTRDGAAVWALGDGAYAFSSSAAGLSTQLNQLTSDPVLLGPFAENAPPYLAYDLLGDPREAHFAVASSSTDTIVIATDGVCDLLEAGSGLDRFATSRLLDHPDALRRELSLLARAQERIDWDARRIERVPAVLQDDCAIGVLFRRCAS